MNLVIDAGNTLLKLAVFEGGILKHQEKIEYENFEKNISDLKNKYSKIERVIFSSVSKLTKEQIKKALKGLKFIILSHKTKLPFVNLYKTPETLGVDRIALAAASYTIYPSKSCLVIDCGTCITYDFIDDKGCYLGGGISPGLQMRYKSLNDYTANLPLLTANYHEILLGNTTETAIHSGVFNGFCNEISGIITEFGHKYPGLVVILTGGNAKTLSKRLKSGIFVDPNFLFKGLNYILDFNSSK